jgi:hypothetical protein
MEIEQIETHGNCTHGNLFTLQLDPDSLPAQDIVERKAFILSNQPLSRTATKQQTQHSDKFVSDDLDVTALKKRSASHKTQTKSSLYTTRIIYPSINPYPSKQTDAKHNPHSQNDDLPCPFSLITCLRMPFKPTNEELKL